MPGSDNKLSCYESLPTSPYNCREDRPDLIIAWHTEPNYGQNYAKLVSQNKLICLQPSPGHLGRGHFPQLTNNKQTEREGERERERERWREREENLKAAASMQWQVASLQLYNNLDLEAHWQIYVLKCL